MAGTVAEVARDSPFKPGDKVFGPTLAGEPHSGTLAEYCLAPSDMLGTVPPAIIHGGGKHSLGALMAGLGLYTGLGLPLCCGHWHREAASRPRVLGVIVCGSVSGAVSKACWCSRHPHGIAQASRHAAQCWCERCAGLPRRGLGARCGGGFRQRRPCACVRCNRRAGYTYVCGSRHTCRRAQSWRGRDHRGAAAADTFDDVIEATGSR
jgi:hypothetical protein